MRTLMRALWAETLKFKRSLAFWLAVVAPLVVVFLQFVLIFDRGQSYLQENTDPWLLLGRQTIIFWSLLMLPLFVTLETALVAGLEHSGDNWKHLFVLPVPRTVIYLTKLAAGFGLIALSQVFLILFIVLAGGVLNLLRPEIEFGWSVPWLSFFKYAGLGYLSAWLLIALHTWVAVRWRNFVVAVGFGIAMTIAGVLVINSHWANLYPWTLPTIVLSGLREGRQVLTQLLLGAGGGLVATVLGGWEYLRRDVL